jgi:hypothetical protein
MAGLPWNGGKLQKQKVLLNWSLLSNLINCFILVADGRQNKLEYLSLASLSSQV